MNLSYSPSTGHVKRDGAVVGRIDGEKFACAVCKKKIKATKASPLLARVRAHFEKEHP